MKILNMQKQAFVQNLEKAFKGQGVYQDNYKNRKLGRVGQPYKKETSPKEENEEKDKKKPKKQLNSEEAYDKFVKNYIDNLPSDVDPYSDGTIGQDKNGNEYIRFHQMVDSEETINKARRFAKKYNLKTARVGGYDDLVIYKPKSSSKKEDKASKVSPKKKEKDDTEEKKKLSYIEARTVLGYSNTLANATTRQLNNVINYSGFDIDKNLSDDEKREKLAQKYYASADLYELTSAKEVANALDDIIEDALADYVPKK